MKQILNQVSWIMRGCKFCFSFRKSFAFSAFKSTLQLTSFVLRTHSTANPLQNDGLGSLKTLGATDSESGLAAEAVGETVSFPETPFSAANQEKFRMTVYGMKQILNTS